MILMVCSAFMVGGFVDKGKEDRWAPKKRSSAAPACFGLSIGWSRVQRLLGRARESVMRDLKKLDGWGRDRAHDFLNALEYRLAPLTLVVLLVVLAGSAWCWDSWRGDDSNGTAIRNLVLIMAAIAALPLAIWRSKVAERQAATAQRQSETAQRGLLNERYQKGADMLGSGVLAVRLGGIYALARLAREYPGDYHTQIMNLLCAFVRNPTPTEVQGRHTNAAREDVEAVMPAICARSAAQLLTEEKEFYFQLDLSGADLRYVSFLLATSLGNSDLQPPPGASANLEGAFLNGADLSGAILMWSNLKNTSFYDANLEGAVLTGADLSGADLRDCKGLTQEQIDQAKADSDNRPDLEGMVDARTGKPLVWRGRASRVKRT